MGQGQSNYIAQIIVYCNALIIINKIEYMVREQKNWNYVEIIEI